MPISDKQLAANRANAQKSTGPRTPEGKAVCSMNGFAHGLTGLAVVMTDEDRIVQDEFVLPIVQSLNPIAAMEVQLARSAALDQFRLNRLKAIEENMLAWTELGPLGEKIDTEHARVHHGMTQARAFFNNDRGFNNLSLYEQRITRNVHKNLKLLRELQAERKAEERLNAKTQPLTRTASTGSEENGFEFSSTPSQTQDSAQEVPEAQSGLLPTEPAAELTSAGQATGQRPGLRFGSLIATEADSQPTSAGQGFGFPSSPSQAEKPATETSGDPKSPPAGLDKAA